MLQLSRERGTTTIITTHYVEEAKGAARVSLSLSYSTDSYFHLLIFVVHYKYQRNTVRKYASVSLSLSPCTIVNIQGVPK